MANEWIDVDHIMRVNMLITEVRALAGKSVVMPIEENAWNRSDALLLARVKAAQALKANGTHE